LAIPAISRVSQRLALIATGAKRAPTGEFETFSRDRVKKKG
jgi:hypothetical protein